MRQCACTSMVFTRRPLTTTSRRLTAGCAEPAPDCTAAASRGSCAAISPQLVKTSAGSTARGWVALCVFIAFSYVGWVRYYTTRHDCMVQQARHLLRLGYRRPGG